MDIGMKVDGSGRSQGKDKLFYINLWNINTLYIEGINDDQKAARNILKNSEKKIIITSY